MTGKGSNSMSADNGVYILQTKGPEFRVAHAQGIDNIFGEWDEERKLWTGNAEYILSTFGESNVFATIEEAYDVAEAIERSLEYTEYGVCLVVDFETQNYIDLIEKEKEDGAEV